jgi:hypothetical protein
MSEVLDVQASLQTTTGWLDLDDAAAGYELGSDSFSEKSISHRKTEVANEWVEGSYVSRSVRDNIGEVVSVYIIADTPYDLAVKVDRITSAFDQLSYQMIVRFADSQETWDCSLADYTVSTKQEMRFATMALVKATVPHLPTVTRVQV